MCEHATPIQPPLPSSHRSRAAAVVSPLVAGIVCLVMGLRRRADSQDKP
jgi:hypothetical protein